MGNLNMEATQIHYRHDSTMTVDKKLQNLEGRVTTLEDGEPAEVSKADIAPVFSAESAYSAGDYVYHEGHLYKFTADHAAGAWSDIDTETAVVTADLAEQAGDIDELKSGLTTLDTEVNGDSTTYPYADVITVPDAIPANLANCNVKIEPVQSGTGEPSPTNIRPITGHTEASVQRDGKNLVSAIEPGGFGQNGDDVSATNRLRNDGYVTVIGGSKYTVSNSASLQTAVFYWDEQGVTTPYQSSGWQNSPYTFEVPVSAKYVRIMLRKSDNSDLTPHDTDNIQIEYGETATAYTQYVAPQTYTKQLGGTYYGFDLDYNTGVMTVTHVYAHAKDFTWGYNGTTETSLHEKTTGIPKAYGVFNIISDKLASDGDYVIRGRDDSNTVSIVLPLSVAANDTEFAAWLNAENPEICYELATPTTIQLTPQQIQLLKGTNTLYASTGQISVTVNGVSGAIGAVQTQANSTDAALAELAADIAEKLPTAPTTDGAYVLTVTVADGTPTYSWESAS